MSVSHVNIKAAALPSIHFRPSSSRGTANHGWLLTSHSFSFADWYSPKYNQLGALRVLNEDWVSPKQGFGTHGHANFEIFSYIVSGELTHQDSMGNIETLKRGDVQHTTAGKGIRHSEKNDGTLPVHFLQIWVKPWETGLTPSYQTLTVSDQEKIKGWASIVGPATKDLGIKLQQDFYGYATLLKPSSGELIYNKSHGPDRKIYLHNVEHVAGGIVQVHARSRFQDGMPQMGQVVKLSPGDAVQIEGFDGSQHELIVSNVETSDIAKVGIGKEPWEAGVAELILLDSL